MSDFSYVYQQAFVMNDERKEARLRRRRERSRERHAAETSEHREARLARFRDHRTAESSEQREARCQVVDRARRTSRSTSQRDRSLQQRREELSRESAEAREVQFHQLRVSQQSRLASETPEQMHAHKYTLYTCTIYVHDPHMHPYGTH